MSHLEIPLDTEGDYYHLTLIHFPVTNYKLLLYVQRVMHILTGGKNNDEYTNGYEPIPEMELALPAATFGRMQRFGWRDKKDVRIVVSPGILKLQETIAEQFRNMGIRYSKQHFKPHVTSKAHVWKEGDQVPLLPIIRFIANKELVASYALRMEQ